MFDLEKFKTGKYYVHLPTQELYDEVMKFLDSHGFVWANGNLLECSDKWSYFEKLTSIIGWDDDTVKFGSIVTCVVNDYEWLDISDKLKEE